MYVTADQAVSYEIFAPGDFYGSALSAAMPKIKEAAQALRDKTETLLKAEDVSWEWEFCYGMAEHHLLSHSALQDVIIVGPRDVSEHGNRPSDMVGDLVMGSRTPVLVVPENNASFDVNAPVLVAWNGSAEACAALRASLPLLQTASQVYLASVAEDNPKDRHKLPPVDGAKYLSRYGIHAELVEVPKGEAAIADTLESAAQMRECSAMVMGAYGHSRLAQMLMGGVTRRSLTDPALPILMAH